MTKEIARNTHEIRIRELLERWAENTRLGNRDEILSSHASDVLIFDVLAPMKYEGAEAYRASWDEWQPETEGPGGFDLRELKITAGQDVAFAHGLILCGGTLADGTTFEDRVRATFCLRRRGDTWKITHQHISSPFAR